jgi:dipeptidyl aminopeptidase/acylaminoacyl peptidase
MNKIVLPILLVISLQLFGQEKLTPELLWEIDRISQDDISSDGSTLLFGVTSYDLDKNKGDRNLYLMSSNGGNPDMITDFEGSEYNAQFRPNFDKIGFLYGGEFWEMNRDGSEKTKISDVKMGSFKYSPDGSKILYTSELVYDSMNPHPDLPLATARIFDQLMYRHWDHWEDGKYSNLFIAELNEKGMDEGLNITPFAHDVPLQPFGNKSAYNWSPDMQWIAYTCKKMSGKTYAESTNSDIYLYHVPSGKTMNLTEDNPGYDKEPVFSPDGTFIAWNSMARDGYESDKNRIYVQNLKTGNRKELTKAFDENANHPQFSNDGTQIFFLSGVNATVQLFKVSVEGGEVEQLTQGRHNYYDFLVAEEFLITRKASMMNAHELYKVSLENGRDERMSFATQEVMGKIQQGRVRKHWVKTHDGKDMLVWLIYPPNFDPQKKYPALLYCQGGPQAAVNQFFSFRWNFQLMAANDYIIVAPNRRGLPSFGTEWNESISKDWGGGAMQDYLTAIDSVLILEPAIDSDRLGAIGASFGGYSVYWLAGNHNKRFKTFISHCGLFNLESWYGTTEELFFANWDIGGPYWEDKWKADYQAFSPHRFVKNWDTPILVIHGEKDFRVPVSEGIQAFHVAQMQDIDSRFLYFPDEGHWVLSPQNGVFWHRTFFDWLDRYLK